MAILLFDGHCNLCNAWVQFIVQRDSAKKIRFASLQSKAGRQMLEKHKIDENYFDSLVLVEGEKFFVSSSAALKTLSLLAGWERHFQLLIIAGCRSIQGRACSSCAARRSKVASSP